MNIELNKEEVLVTSLFLSLYGNPEIREIIKNDTMLDEKEVKQSLESAEELFKRLRRKAQSAGISSY